MSTTIDRANREIDELRVAEERAAERVAKSGALLLAYPTAQHGLFHAQDFEAHQRAHARRTCAEDALDWFKSMHGY